MNAFEERMQQLRSRFVERSLADRKELGAALAAGEHRTAIRILHSLAGNAGMFGYPALSEAARDLEQALEKGTTGGVGRMLQGVLDALPESAQATPDEAG